MKKLIIVIAAVVLFSCQSKDTFWERDIKYHFYSDMFGLTKDSRWIDSLKTLTIKTEP
jgi:hypothetical protein